MTKSIRPELALIVDHAEAVAKRQGHETVERRHLLVALLKAMPEGFVNHYGEEAPASVVRVLDPRGTYFGPLRHDQSVDDLLERAEATDGIEVLFKELGSLIELQPAATHQTAAADTDVTETDSSNASTGVPPQSFEDALSDLHGLVGLEEAKAQIAEFLELHRVAELREARGMPHLDLSTHLVFTGNPGTGKTTAARIVGRIFAALGLVSRGSFIEASRADLVGAYVGKTALKTADVVKRALGGVLFIDEAYSLARDHDETDFGHEAIAELVKQMEDHRGDLVVIVAGYPREMQQFLDSNPGLYSRFGRLIQFPDYGVADLLTIFKSMTLQHGYVLAPGIEALLTRYFARMKKEPHFGNGRLVRNVFERAVGHQATRLTSSAEPSDDELQLITEADCSFLEVPDSEPQPTPTGQYL